MDPLATPEDVARALGLGDSAEFSESQARRVEGLLARVSREFRREAQREFTAGTSTLRLLTVAGRVRTPDPIETVESVVLDDCGETVELEFEVDGQWVVVERFGRRLGSGVPVTITYAHAEDVPDDVVETVAGIVGRNLTLDPQLGPVTEMYAGPFRQRLAEWTNSTDILTEEERRIARSYRCPGSNVIIQVP